MRLLLPARGFPPLFYEVNISEEPASLAITGFDHRHRAVAEADMRPDGAFGLISTQILGENAVTVRATLSQTGGWPPSKARSASSRSSSSTRPPTSRRCSRLPPSASPTRRHWHTGSPLQEG